MTHAPAARKRPGAEDDDGESETDSSTVPPPDGGWGWFVVWASFMIHIVSKYSKWRAAPLHCGAVDTDEAVTALLS